MLEGVLARPDKPEADHRIGQPPSGIDNGGFWAGIICHPHPLYGGNMDNTMVMTAWEAFTEANLISLRFNFRGTGRSQGRHGGGETEQEDVRAAIDYLAAQNDCHESGIILAGYSFGAMVGLRVGVKDPRVSALIAIAPPLIMDDFSFLEDCPKPRLIIAGDNDNVCPKALVDNLYQCLKEPKRFSSLPGADHSLFGAEQEIKRTIIDFIEASAKL